jgi:hypothetical protein
VTQERGSRKVLTVTASLAEPSGKMPANNAAGKSRRLRLGGQRRRGDAEDLARVFRAVFFFRR